MSDSSRTSPIAIVGLACRLPGAANLDEYWDLLKNGRTAYGELPESRFDRKLYFHPDKGVIGKSYTTLAGLIPDNPATGQALGLPQRLKESVDIAHLNMCDVAVDALRHAKMDPFRLKDRNVGVYIGGVGGSGRVADLLYSSIVEETASYLHELPELKTAPYARQAGFVDEVASEVVGTIRARYDHLRRDGAGHLAAYMSAGLISRALNLNGPYMALDAACASSLMALKLALHALEQGTMDMAIVGSASYCKSDGMVLFSHAQAMSARDSRPFDADADGLICAEGYVAFIAKRLDRAIADGDPIQCVIRGIGVSSDGRGKSLWVPRKEGQIVAIRRAYADGLDATRVQYIEAHATSTQVGDATELTALVEGTEGLFSSTQRVPIGACKGNIGHTLETAGAAGLAKVLLAMHHGVVPPAVNIERLNPKVDWSKIPFYVPTAPEAWPEHADGHPRRAAVNSFGIGGLNVHMVVDQYQSRQPKSFYFGTATHNDALVEARNAEPIAVIGMGAIFPGAYTIDAFWDLLSSGTSAIGDVPDGRWNKKLGYAAGAKQPWKATNSVGGFIRDYQYDWRKNKIPPKQIAQGSPLQFMLLDAAAQAIAHAGYDQRPFDHAKVGVVVGTMFGGDFVSQLQAGMRLPEFDAELTKTLRARGVADDQIKNVVAQYREKLLEKMPALVDETGSFTCSTMASRVTKMFDLMGGALALDGGESSGLAAVMACANILRGGSCDMMICAAGQRSMDLFAFEALSSTGVLASGTPRPAFDARSDGIVPGEGVGVLLLKRLSDARRDGDPIRAVIRGIGVYSDLASPERALAPALQRAIESAGGSAADVVAIETTGGAAAQAADDLDQLAAVLGAQRDKPALVGSLAGIIGHLGSASGVASLIKTCISLEKQQFPQGVKIEQPVASLLKHSATFQPPLGTVPLNTKTAQRTQLVDVISGTRSGQTYHVLVEHGFETAVASADAPPVRAKSTPIAAASEMPRGKLRVAFMFPGQGSQYPGMLRQLVDEFPPAAEAMRRADSVMARLGCGTFAEIAWHNTAGLGVDIEQTLLSILLADYIVAESLAALGVRPGVVAGHSFGEYPALLAAGAWSLETAIECTRIRAEALTKGITVDGAMLAVNASAEGAKLLVSQTAGRVYVANFNGPEQTVLAGERGALARAAELAKYSGYHTIPLAVPGAFHTPLMSAAAEMFSQRLPSLAINAASVPVIGTVTAESMQDAESIRRSLISQLTNPVRYVELVERIVNDAPTVLVEVGPQQVLTKLHRAILAGRNVAQIACCDNPKAAGLEQLMSVVALLKSCGALEEQVKEPSKPKVQIAAAAPRKEGTLIHFDATERRRTARRESATQERRAAAPVGNGHKRPAPQPKVETSRAEVKFPEPMPSERRQPPSPSPAPSVARGNGQVAVMQAAPAAAAPALEDLKEFLIAFVVEHTGYPAEIVELDADLEADLGIDSIKKAALFGELGEQFKIAPPAGNVTLDDFTTLRHVYDFIVANSGNQPVPVAASENGNGAPHSPPVAPVIQQPTNGAAAAAAKPPVEVASRFSQSAELDEILDDLEAFLIEFVVEHTGYSTDDVDLDADLEADLGIDSIKKAQLFGELAERFQLSAAQGGVTLEDFPTLRHVLNFVQQSTGRSKTGTAPEAAVVREAVAAPRAATAPTPTAPIATAPIATAAPQAPPPTNGEAAKPAPSAATIDLEPLRQWLIDFVVEQTGYSPEEVDLDADLEADLGIDSIKKAQLFGELGERFRIAPPSGNVTLDDFTTLRHVVDFLEKSPPGAATAEPDSKPIAAPTEPRSQRVQTSSESDRLMSRFVFRLVAQPLTNEVEKDTWGRRALVVGNNSDAQALSAALRQKGLDVQVLDAGSDPAAAAALVEKAWQAGPIEHLFLLTGRDRLGVSYRDEAAWNARRAAGLMAPFAVCQKWYELGCATSGGAKPTLAAVTALGGDLGFGGDIGAVEGGGIAGLLKAIGVETNGGIKLRLIDLPSDYPSSDLVRHVIDELEHPSTDIEVCYNQARERRVVRARRQLASVLPARSVPRGSTWIVTGGARGITYYVARELGRRFGLRLHLLGSSPPPRLDPLWRELSAEQMKEAKAREIAAIVARDKVSPAEARSRIERAIELDHNLNELSTSGVAATYHQCDVSDRRLVAELVERIRQQDGRIAGVMHGAALESASKLPKKKLAIVDKAIGAKVDGAAALLAALADDPPQFFLAFGSTSGRFGGLGQTDYSLANDMLCKMVSQYRREHPSAMAVAIDWSSWDKIGMSARPESKFALQGLNVRFMDPSEGVDHLIDEMQAESQDAEVLVIDHPGCASSHITMSDVDAPPEPLETKARPVPAASSASPDSDRDRDEILAYLKLLADIDASTAAPAPPPAMDRIACARSLEELEAIAAQLGVATVCLLRHNRNCSDRSAEAAVAPGTAAVNESPPRGPVDIREFPMLSAAVWEGGKLKATALVDPQQDIFLRDHRLYRRPFMPAVISLEILAEAASCTLPHATLVGLDDVELSAGHSFVSDAQVALEALTSLDGSHAARGQLAVQGGTRNTLVTARTVFADAPPPAEQYSIGTPYAWFPFEYPDNWVTLFHGPTFRTYRELQFQRDSGWGKLVAPDHREMAGQRPGARWFIPSALLDGCMMACGSYSYFMLGRRVVIPRRIGKLRIFRQARAGETCLLHYTIRRIEPKSTVYDFHLTTEQDEVLMKADEFEMVAIEQPGKK